MLHIRTFDEDPSVPGHECFTITCMNSYCCTRTFSLLCVPEVFSDNSKTELLSTIKELSRHWSYYVILWMLRFTNRRRFTARSPYSGWVRYISLRSSPISNHRTYPRLYIGASTNVSTWICLHKYERLVKKDHKIRAGIEPTFSDNRSAVLPLNYPIFSLA